MKYYRIEVDERIWNYLKTLAEPFVDTPNSVLTRLLFQPAANHDNLSMKIHEGKVDVSNNTSIEKHNSHSHIAANRNTQISFVSQITSVDELTDQITSVDELTDHSIQASVTPKISSAQNIYSSIPLGLSQILDVVQEVKVNGHTRKDATQIVAQKRGTSPLTIMDKYCRQLNKTSREFDELLTKENGLQELKALLIDRFQNYSSIINDFFQPLIN